MTPQASPNRSTLTWLIPITLLIAVCALVGGLIARQLYATSKPVDTKPPASAPSGPTTDTGHPDDTESVYFTEFAKADPDADQVQRAIQNYFNAINKRDYKKWQQTMTPEAGGQTESYWRNGYKSTVDKDMHIYRIEDTEQGADVFGSFTSYQDLADAPDELKATCVRWNMIWPMVSINGVFRIGKPSIAPHACGT
ncbi:hypothetical protein [Kutzneria chonburiensis]|uniref:Uncharacterized protein n=1 Tax=Kutzneria chonburiensis TaxID=1483604 RepID=A0ABV6MI36_9PSEU|nr:hypothetical protein [Kutzneria chonburiensis]